MTNEEINKLFDFLNEDQIEAIKLIVRTGFWGDADQSFQDGNVYYAHGHYTNMGKGKDWSGRMSGVVKSIKNSKTNVIVSCSDYWGNGSGDMMFFNMEILEQKSLRKWALQ